MENLSERKKLYDFVFPSYIKDFSCIGSKCEDTCCAGWKVTIDKKTYLKYKKYNGENKDLKELFRKNISRNRNVNSIISYGKIKDTDNFCPFLNEDKLCKIHMSLGKEYLSYTCDKYPRIYKKINNVVEYSSTLSCPEAARLALKNKEGIKLESEKREIDENIIFTNDDNFNKSKKNSLILQYFFDIQSLVISILQYNNISLENSIILIGSLSKSIKESSKENNIEDIILKYSDSKYLESYSKSLVDIKPFYSCHLEIFSEWIKLILFNKKENNKYDNYIEEAFKNIFNEEFIKDNSNKLNFYEKKGIPRYKKLLEKKSYIFENYLVNLFFQSGYPMNENQDMEKRQDIFLSYMNLTIVFLILRTTIIGLLINKEDMEEEMLIDIIQSFSKRIYHNRSLINNLIKQIKIKDLYSYSASILMLNL